VPDPKLTIVGDSQKAEAAVVALEKRIDKLQHQLKKTSQNARASGKDIQKSFGSQLSAGINSAIIQMVSLQGVMVGIQSAARLAVNEMKAAIDLEKSRGRAQAGFAGSFDSALLNMGQGATANQLQGIIDQVANKTGATPTNIASALSDAFSARGDLSLERAVETVEAVLTMAKNIPDLQAPLTGAALDLQKLSKNATAEDAIGLLLATGGKARVVDPKMLAQNIAPAINQISSAGATSQESASLLASLSQAIVDVQGAVSATAGVALARQMQEFFGNTNFSQNLRTLQTDPNQRAAFLQGASFELKAKTAIEMLLAGGQTADLFADAMANIPGLEQSGGMFRSQVGAMAEGGANQTGALSQRIDSTIQRLLLGGDGQPGVVFDKLDDILRASGEGFLQRQIVGAALIAEQGVGGTGLNVAENAITSRARDIQRGGITPGEQAQINLLRDVFTAIQSLNTETAKNRRVNRNDD
jgi:polyhydroxyalkanoate synthesis regulator phasin